jgi:hypothetical protein
MGPLTFQNVCYTLTEMEESAEYKALVQASMETKCFIGFGRRFTSPCCAA